MWKSHLGEAFDQWSTKGVWRVFKEIGSYLFDWEQVAFTNLARCYEPTEFTSDDDFIGGCQDSTELNALIRAIRPRVVFFAKGGDVGRSISIDGEALTIEVLRYANGSRATHDGRHWTTWVPAEATRLQAIIGARGVPAAGHGSVSAPTHVSMRADRQASSWQGK
jgi:hypothetical protein